MMFNIKYVTEDIVPGRYRAELESNDEYQYEAYLNCTEFKNAFGPLQSHASIYKKGTGIALYDKWYDGIIKKDRAIVKKLLSDLVAEFNQSL